MVSGQRFYRVDEGAAGPRLGDGMEQFSVLFPALARFKVDSIGAFRGKYVNVRVCHHRVSKKKAGVDCGFGFLRIRRKGVAAVKNSAPTH